MTYEEALQSVLSYCVEECGKIDTCRWEYNECAEATVIKALEKQISKKVCTTTNRFNVTHYHCPRRECHAELEYENQRYCDDCGQALNWEGIE